jgi:hypothetical protein
MRVKAGHAVQAGKRYIDFPGQSPELLGGYVSELALNLPEVFENQRRSPRTGRNSIFKRNMLATERWALSMIDIANPKWQVQKGSGDKFSTVTSKTPSRQNPGTLN